MHFHLRFNFYFSLGDRINETFNELVKWVDVSDSKVGLLQNVLLTINPEILGDVEQSFKNNLNMLDRSNRSAFCDKSRNFRRC